MEPTTLSIDDYVDIAKRRIWSFILPTTAIILAAGIIAFVLPSEYKSSSTILIEQQEIPEEFVSATVTSFAEQRLQSINQRIMSTSKLLGIINELDLYQDLRGKWTTDEIVERMRENIKLDTISAEVIDQRTGRPTTTTIAFSLAFQGKDARQVHQVAGTLTSLYLEENLKVRRQQTEETYTFIGGELQRVQSDLSEIEKKISAFKEQHLSELPEMFQVNTQAVNLMERSIERLDEQKRSLKEREGYLETQLASIPRKQDPKKQRLQSLHQALTSLKTRFSQKHPDVVKTQQEIAEIEAQIAAESASAESNDILPENSAYITLSAQLASTRADILSVQNQISDLENKAREYRRRIENTPRVEQEYNRLLNERQNNQAKYNDLMQKHLEAKVAYALESEQKGERFTLIDPARLPEKPFKPNRLAILLIGIVLGTGAGVGLAALREFTDHSVRKAESLAEMTSLPVLAGIPEIITPRDRRRRRVRVVLIVSGAVVLIAAAIAVFHYWVMDLDIFWMKLLRRADKEFIL